VLDVPVKNIAGMYDPAGAIKGSGAVSLPVLGELVHAWTAGAR